MKMGSQCQKFTKITLPAIMKVTDILNDTGKDIAPIGSVQVIFDCNERKKQIQTADTTNEQKRAGMQMLESYTTTSRAIELKEVTLKMRMLYDLIIDSWSGVHVVPVKPELITSTDDSTVFIFCGSTNKPDEFHLEQRNHV